MNRTGAINKSGRDSFKKDKRNFLIVMIGFTLGMAFLLYYEISAWYIWYLYLGVWTYLEYRIARNIPLRWWHWIIILLAILMVDWIVLEMIDLLKK